jgi:hypothetical protein
MAKIGHEIAMYIVATQALAEWMTVVEQATNFKPLH